MIRNVNNLRELIEKVKENNDTYTTITSHFEFLMKERIKITQNSLRTIIGRPEKEIDKPRLIASVKKINEIAESSGVDFHIDEDWESIEAFLRMSTMEDIAGEFQKQANS